MAEMPLSIHSTLRGRIPTGGLPLAALKDAVLGTNYELSLVFIGDKRSRSLNKQFRGKDKPADVLSFSLDKTTGEIFINPHEAKRRAPFFSMTTKGFLCFLFIHGMLHLKGYDHGSRMEQAEERFVRAFSLS